MRGLPKSDTIDCFLENGFILLEELEKKEIIIGFLFGVTVKEIRKVPPEQFAEFNNRNYIKGVWNLKLCSSDHGNTFSTETRVFCPTKI